MAVERLDKNNDDGTIFGLSDSKIGFYGLTAPIVKPSFTAAAVSTVVGDTTGHWSFATSTQPNGIVSLLNEIRAKLVAFGLVST